MRISRLWARDLSRRALLKGLAGGALLSALDPLASLAEAADPPAESPLFWVTDIPRRPFLSGGNRHAGVDALLEVMGSTGLKFYRSPREAELSGPLGLIQPDDVVLIKVNAQWKYRGATNSDVVRGLIQAILDHPDGYSGEIVIVENGQGRGSLRCDTSQAYGGDTSVRANAIDPSHSFVHLVERIFRDPRVSAYLLDPIRNTFIGPDDHVTDGYRRRRYVSYPCFTTPGGHRVELKEGLWRGAGFQRNLKLINVPVLKHHDTGGSEITASLKHYYGLLSMADGWHGYRHYEGLGRTCGKMVAAVRAPVLSIIDATWVSYASLKGYPAETTRRVNQLLASQDPVALDFWAAKHILYPLDGNMRHHPAFPGISSWLTKARDTINDFGGLYDPESGIMVGMVTKRERRMRVHRRSLPPAERSRPYSPDARPGSFSTGNRPTAYPFSKPPGKPKNQVDLEQNIDTINEKGD